MVLPPFKHSEPRHLILNQKPSTQLHAVQPLDCVVTGGTICLGWWQRRLCTKSPATQLLAGFPHWWFDGCRICMALFFPGMGWCEQSVWIWIDLADLDLGQHHSHRRRTLVGTSYPVNLACFSLLAKPLKTWSLGICVDSSLRSLEQLSSIFKYGATSPSLVRNTCNQKLPNVGLQWAKSKQSKSSAKWQFEHISAADVRVNQSNCPTTSAKSI